MKNTHLLVGLFLGLVVFFINAEYVVYKSTESGNQQLIPSEHEAVYQLLMNYQFPMSLAKDNTLTEEEKNLLEKNEERYIASRIYELDPSYKVVFVPPTVYELVLLSFQKKDKDISNWFKLNGYLSTWKSEEVCTEARLIHQAREVINFHYLINNRIASMPLHLLVQGNEALFWKTHVKNYVDEQIKRVTKLMDTKTKRVNNNFFACDEAFLSPFLNEIINNAIDLEFQAHKKNKYILYRFVSNSTSGFPITNYKEKGNHIPYLLSFGTSLLAGFANDRGSCPLYLFLASLYFDYTKVTQRNKINGYVVFIDISVKEDNPAHTLFYMPWSNTISTFYGEGQHFHAITKACFANENSVNKISFYDHIMSDTNLKDKTNLHVTFMEENEFCNLFARYLKNNSQAFPYAENKIEIMETVPDRYIVYDSEEELSGDEESASDEESCSQESEQENNKRKRIGLKMNPKQIQKILLDCIKLKKVS